jgi:hypothetical protein
MSSQKECQFLKKQNCCPSEEKIDCCSNGYLRLDKLRTAWSMIVTGGFIFPNTCDNNGLLYLSYAVSGTNQYDYNSSGNIISAPISTYFETPDESGTGIGLVDISFGETTNNILIINDNSYYAYLFSNTSRYNSNQDCGRDDQVIGWLFDISTENLEVFQNIQEYNLTPQINRLSLINVPESDLTVINKKQLNGLNYLYKLSLKALKKAVVPRAEGDIVIVTDKNGKSWTIAINSASSSGWEGTNTYVIVATPSC